MEYRRGKVDIWGRLSIKMSSYQYMDPHFNDKTVLGHGNPIHGKTIYKIDSMPCLWKMVIQSTTFAYGLIDGLASIYLRMVCEIVRDITSRQFNVVVNITTVDFMNVWYA